jgi:Arc/MetJ-type ribon-helix-helix transcriptional regulator
VSASYPSDVQQFVEQKLAAGAYPSEQALVIDAVRHLRDQEEDARRFRAQLQDRIASLDRGEGVQLDADEDLAAYLANIEAEVDAQLGGQQQIAP